MQTLDWVRDLAFLTDITNHLNKLNLELQGKNQTLLTTYTAVKAFMIMINLFLDQLSKMELRHFNQLRLSIEEEPEPTPNMDRYLEWTNQVKQNFSNRFQDFEHISDALNFLQDPVQFSFSKVEHLAQIFSMDCAKIETDLIVLQSCPTGSTFDWRNVTQSYIRLLADKILSIFSSTYICEVTFSAMKAVRIKLIKVATE